MLHPGPGTPAAAVDPLRSWSRRGLLGLPALVVIAGCSVPNPYKEEDDAVADALSSEPMWVAYRPAWVTSESSVMGWRRAGDFEPTGVMMSNRFLHGVVPADAVTTARTAAVQAGWGVPDVSDPQQLRRAQGKGRAVMLRLFISATDTSLGISINGSFG